MGIFFALIYSPFVLPVNQYINVKKRKIAFKRRHSALFILFVCAVCNAMANGDITFIYVFIISIVMLGWSTMHLECIKIK